MPEMLGTNDSFEACSTAVIFRTFMEQLLPLFLVVGYCWLEGELKGRSLKTMPLYFIYKNGCGGGRSIVRFQWCISTCLEKAFAPAQGLLIKVMVCAFVPAVPVQEGYLTFESPYPKHTRTWLARAGWEGGMATHAVEWQLGGAQNGNAGWCLSPGRAPALEDELSFPLLCGCLFSRAASTD